MTCEPRNRGIATYLIEESAGLRRRLAMMLQSISGISLVGMTGNIRDAMIDVRDLAPAVVVIGWA